MKKKAKELNDFLNNMVKEGKIKKNNFKELLSDIQNIGKEPIQVMSEDLNKMLGEIKETFAVRPSKIEYTRVDAIEQATIYFEPDITIDFDRGLNIKGT